LTNRSLKDLPVTSLPPFPEPKIIGRLRLWSKGLVRAWLAEVAGKPAPKPRHDDDALMSTRTMREQYLGGVSEPTLWRWRQQGRTMAA
jgi:hypothetical protein